MSEEEDKDKFDLYQQIQKKSKCPICGVYKNNSGFHNHVKYCKIRKGDWNPDHKKISEDKIYTCKHCGKSFDHNYRARNGHQMKCKENPQRNEVNKKISDSKKGSKKPKEIRKKISDSMKEYRKVTDKEDSSVVGKIKIITDKKTNDGFDLFFNEEI